MTADRAERVPEHPRWPTHWLRYAEYEGRRLQLIDEDRRVGLNVHRLARFVVQRSPGIMPCCDPECVARDAEHGLALYRTDSLADAEAAFEEAARRLREEG